jgi:hypothetical protein
MMMNVLQTTRTQAVDSQTGSANQWGWMDGWMGAAAPALKLSQSANRDHIRQ